MAGERLITVDACSPVFLMGVAGAGKTTVGRVLADRLGMDFQEGDALHPASNVAKLRAGVALDDEDRRPWLDAVADWIGSRIAERAGGVVSCSALRRAYRDRLRTAGGADLPFILLDVGEAILRDRLSRRRGHFMPAALLASQLATLERPAPGERALVLTGPAAVDTQVSQIVRWLGAPAKG